MKTFLLIVLFSLGCFTTNAQSCEELMAYVKSESYGTTYNSFNSDAISKVTFYEVSVNYQYHYFAIVCFKREYYGCTEYIYQVESNTKSNYSRNYYNSAGKAFWKYIEPYSDNLGCSPEF